MNSRLAWCLAVLMMVAAAAAAAQHSSSAGAAPETASTIIDNAVKRAGAESKTVWVDFGASWCGWCRKLEAFLDAPDVKDIIQKHYIMVNLTVMESASKKALENPGGEAVMKELGGASAGLPFYAYLDGSGKKIANSMAMPNGSNIGFPADKVELDAFVSLLDKTAPRLTGEERGRLLAYLNRVVPAK